MLSTVTNYIINRFKQDDLVNTIALRFDGLIDSKKENIYPLVDIFFNEKDLSVDEIATYDFTITVLQQRDNRKVVKPSKLMEDENCIDNLNECDSICTNFINYIRRMELEPITIQSLSIIETVIGYGGANLDGFRFDVTIEIPNTGFCHAE
jgi:hypothetical protein